MKGPSERITRRELLQASTAGLAGSLICGPGPLLRSSLADSTPPLPSRIYHARHGTPVQNVAKVFEMGYGGIEKFIGKDDIVLLRPNLQWRRNGYVNTDVGKAMIDLILNRPGGFMGEIIVIEDQHRSDPHTNDNSGWITSDKASNGPYNWFELIQYYVDHQGNYPDGIHEDPITGQINLSFQFLQGHHSFTLENPHPILSTYGGKSYTGANELLDHSVDPFHRFKSTFPTATCFYVRRSDLQYTDSIARVSPLQNQYYMSYPIFKSQHSGLYVSYFKDHPTAWDPTTESFGAQRVRLINLCTLNHHSYYAGVTSIVKGHFGMVHGTFHHTGWQAPWPGTEPSTFYYAGGAVGYWMDKIRRADLHVSCAERIGLESRLESNAFWAKDLAISTDPVALDYYVGKKILFPAGGTYGVGGSKASSPDSHDPTLPGGYYGLTLEFCRDPLADHSIINGTLDEDEMAVHLYDFDRLPGDVNGDGVVDLRDQIMIRNRRGQSTAKYPYADVNRDGRIDIADQVEARRRFGDSAP